MKRKNCKVFFGTPANVKSDSKKQKKVRCSFWPNCTKGDDCPFVHPTEDCKYNFKIFANSSRNFPACTFGDQCLFKHPKIECKFGMGCTRPNCAFSHPTGFRPKFGLSPFGLPMALPGMQPHGTPCKNGFSCPRTGCTDSHPLEACKFAMGCMKAPLNMCPFAHTVPVCKFGAKCNRPGCSFAHIKAPTTPPCKVKIKLNS